MSYESPGTIIYDGYGSGNTAAVTAANAIKTDGSAVTQPVSGTITANIGTSGSLALDATLSKLTVAQSTALGANTQALIGGSVTTTVPTYTTGNINPLSLTTSGLLRIDGSTVTQPVSGTITANIGTSGSLALDATLTGGTQTTRITDGTNTATIKAASTAAVAADKAIVVAISPNNTLITSNAAVSTTGATPPASASYTGGSVTTAAPTYTTGQMSALSLTTAGALRVDSSTTTQPISGSITANIGTSGSLALDATVAKLTVAQSTALGTNTQALMGGSVTTNSPTYTTGNINPLSLTTAGALRTDGYASQFNAANLQTTMGSWLGSTTPTVGQKTMANSIPVTISSDQSTGMSFSVTQQESSSYPDPSSYNSSTSFIYSDSVNNLNVRGSVLTDEGSLREDFPGTSLSSSIGTATFTNGSQTVTGSGFTTLPLTTQQYIKRDVDGSTAWALIGKIVSDTSITLDSVYTGTSGTSASSSTLWPAATANGATITVSGGNITLATGTTSGAIAYITRQGDFLPYYIHYLNVAWSQSIANQQASLGFADTWPSPNQAAYIQFSGTSNTSVSLITQSGSAATEIETNNFSLPYGITTTSISKIEIDLEGACVTLLINDEVIGKNKVHVPLPYTSLKQIISVSNTAAAGSTTSLTVDAIYFQNTNIVMSKDSFTGTPNSVILSGKDNIVRGVGSDGRLAVGMDTMMFRDTIEGSVINQTIWSQSNLTMTQAQAAGSLTLNNGAITTINTYSILFSDKQCYVSSEFTVDVMIRARLIHPGSNCTVELGLGSVATTAAPTDGVFFRIDNTGVLKGVINFNGTETTTAAFPTLNSSKYYNFGIRISETTVTFEIDNADDSAFDDHFLAIPATQSSVTLNQHQPLFARVFNSGSAPASAPQIILAFSSVSQQDLATNKDWASQLASINRGSIIDPVTFAQTLQLAANAAPTATTPTNTTVAFATLGGEFRLNGTATSENFLGVFGYQVPSPYNFVITEIIMHPPVVATALGATINIQEWAIMIQASSTNPSTATGFRIPIGMFSAAASAAVGVVYNGQTINWSLKTPLLVYPGQYILVMNKLISGSAAGAYRGNIFINGYFE